jgi:hypothetical protein
MQEFFCIQKKRFIHEVDGILKKQRLVSAFKKYATVLQGGVFFSAQVSIPSTMTTV